MNNQQTDDYLNRFVRAGSDSDASRRNLQEYGRGRSDGQEAREFYERIVGESGFSDGRKEKELEDKKIDDGKKNDRDIRNSVQLSQINSGSNEATNGLQLQINNWNIFRKKNSIFRMIRDGCIKGVKEILSLDRRWLNIKDDYGWTPMMCAAATGNVDVVKYLLEMEADVYEIRDFGGQNAWDIAVKLDKTDVIKLFIDNRVKKEPGEVEVSTDKFERGNNERIYCHVCKIGINSFHQKTHETSTAHLFNAYKEKDVPADYHLPASNIGYRMLKDAGWSEEQGLGREGRGQKNPVSTVLKNDRSGLGLKEKERRRITHFKANDETAIKNKARTGQSFKSSKKRESYNRRMRSKQWEINLRSYMSGD